MRYTTDFLRKVFMELVDERDELLAVLKEAADLLGEMEPDPDLQNRIRAAIAKAQGELHV